MIIGIPKEIMHEEARVAATPETVKKMVADGLTVLFEKGVTVAKIPEAEIVPALIARLRSRL